MSKRKDTQKREEIRQLLEAHTELEKILSEKRGVISANEELRKQLEACLANVTDKTITANKELIEITTKKPKKTATAK